MEADGILVRPEDVGIVPTHVHPSFMVPKMDDGSFTGEYRLVTGLSSLSPFLKPSKLPLPTVEEAFRILAKVALPGNGRSEKLALANPFKQRIHEILWNTHPLQRFKIVRYAAHGLFKCYRIC